MRPVRRSYVTRRPRAQHVEPTIGEEHELFDEARVVDQVSGLTAPEADDGEREAAYDSLQEHTSEPRTHGMHDGIPEDVARLGQRHAMPMKTELPPGWRIEHLMVSEREAKEGLFIFNEQNAVVGRLVVQYKGAHKYEVVLAQLHTVVDPRVKGFGPLLYEKMVDWVTQQGGTLASDPKSVSDYAVRVWDKYLQRSKDPRDNVEAIPTTRPMPHYFSLDDDVDQSEPRTEPSLQYRYRRRQPGA